MWHLKNLSFPFILLEQLVFRFLEHSLYPLPSTTRAIQSDYAEWIRWLQIMFPSPHFPVQHHHPVASSSSCNPLNHHHLSLCSRTTNSLCHIQSLFGKEARSLLSSFRRDWLPRDIWIAEIPLLQLLMLLVHPLPSYLSCISESEITPWIPG